MSNLSDLLIVQLGQETVWGCDVAQTIKLMTIDNFQITPIERSVQIGERRGSLAPAHADIRTIEEATATMSGLINYDDVVWFLDGAFGEATSDEAGYATDAAATITRTYKAPLVTYDTDLEAVPSFTLCEGEADTLANAYSIVGATLNSFGFTFEDGAAGLFSASYIGKQAVADDLDVVADRETVVAMGDHVSLWIDPASDPAGTTAISALAYRVELNVNLNRTLNRHLGSVLPSGYKDNKWDGTLNLVLEMTSVSRAYLDAALSGASALAKTIRVKASTGSSGTAKHLQIDFTGVLLEAPVVHTDADGIVTVELAFSGQYQTDQANWLVVESLNAVV